MLWGNAMTDNPHVARINATLKEKLLSVMDTPGIYATHVEGLSLYRREAINMSGCSVSKPVIALTVQGVKCSVRAGHEYHYGENQCLLAGVDMPGSYYVINPTTEKPFLALSLDLDPCLITQLASEIPNPITAENQQCSGIRIMDADPDLLDAFLRLVDLLEKPEQISIRAPLIIREIHYLLLVSPHGNDLRQLNTFGTQSNQVAQAINWLKNNFKESLKVEELARQVHMATSTFHRHFKEITGMSPLQFHKQLRLYEAQRLMLTDSCDVTNAAYGVGYESSTQFIREYKRLFGAPPHRDMTRRREQMQ